MNWNSKTVEVKKSNEDDTITLHLTPAELVTIIYKTFNSKEIVEVIGELLANYDVSVSREIAKQIEEF